MMWTFEALCSSPCAVWCRHPRPQPLCRRHYTLQLIARSHTHTHQDYCRICRKHQLMHWHCGCVVNEGGRCELGVATECVCYITQMIHSYKRHEDG